MPRSDPCLSSAVVPYGVWLAAVPVQEVRLSHSVWATGQALWHSQGACYLAGPCKPWMWTESSAADAKQSRLMPGSSSTSCAQQLIKNDMHRSLVDQYLKRKPQLGSCRSSLTSEHQQAMLFGSMHM